MTLKKCYISGPNVHEETQHHLLSGKCKLNPQLNNDIHLLKIANTVKINCTNYW